MKSLLCSHVCTLALLSALAATSACQAISKLDDLKFDAATTPNPLDASSGSGGNGGKPNTMDAAIEDKPSESLVTPTRQHDGGALTTDAGSASRTCAISDGNDCDPVHQCGCESGKHCQVVGSEQRAQCKPIGAKAAWSACSAASQCPQGQTCDRGSCRPYCKADADCDGGSCVAARAPDGAASERYKVCWKHCAAANNADNKAGCGEGTSCRTLKTPDGKSASFCAAPADPCPTTDNGMCDEPQGTGNCASGTDKKDCCERPKGFACDLVQQCGCQADATCYLDTATQVGTCSAPIAGTRKRGEHCSSPTGCEAGLVCTVSSFNVCTSYCRENADCGPNAGCFITSANPYGFCVDKCSRGEDTSSCAQDLVCATLPIPRGDYCWKPLTDCNALRRDGICDEASGVCAKGTDPEDCCKPPTSTSKCNPFEQCGCEPNSGMYCQLASDRSFQCGAGGPKKRGDACENISECGEGTICADSICRALCKLDGASCGNDALCIPLGSATDKTTQLAFGACYERCDYEANNCPGKTVCMKTSSLVQFCSVPSPSCPASMIGNGVCDDTRPGGTRLCAMNTDPDCSGP